MAPKQPSNVVTCDICHRDFALTKDLLEEKEVLLEKAGIEPMEVVLTVLTCPWCGKCYTVIMDDEETIGIREELKGIVAKEYGLQSKGRKPTDKLLRRHQGLQRKLSFKRKLLAEKFNGSFYQTEDGKEQLDYHYHG